MDSAGRYLITSNVLINYLIGKRNPEKIYPYFVQRLITLCRKESVILYMTDFDFVVAFLLTMVCGYHQNPSVLSTLNEMAKHINIIEINESILETASILSIHPPDGVRVGAATEHGLDGIVTWDATHFHAQQGVITTNNISGTTVRYINTAEDGDSSNETSIELDVYAVNEFFSHLIDQAEIVQNEQLGAYERLTFRPRLSNIQYQGRLSDSRENWSWVKVEIQLGEHEFISEEADGREGLVHTVLKAINFCLIKQYLNLPPFETIIAVPPLPKTAGLGEVIVELIIEDQKFVKKRYQHDFVFAVATAYLDAVAELVQSNIIPS